MPTNEDILSAISVVKDPEMGISIVDLGLVYGTNSHDGHATITMTLTTPACPAGSSMIKQVKEAAEGVPGVKSASVELVWVPPWDPKTMANEDGRAALGIW